MSDKLNFDTMDIKRLLIDLRKKHKLSLRALSINMSYSYQTLSKYESGIYDIPDSYLKEVFDYFNEDLSLVLKMENSLINNLDILLHSILFDDFDKRLDVIEHLNDYEKFIDYFKYPDKYRIILYVLHQMKLNDNLNVYKSVETNHEKLDSTYQQIVYEYKAFEHLTNNNLNNAINSIEKALSFGSSILFPGLIYYHASLIYYYYGKILLAKTYAEKAEFEFLSTRNFNRLYSTQVHLATINSKLGRYKQSRMDYIELLKSPISLDLKRTIYTNLAWFDFLNKDYSKSLESIYEIEKEYKLSENEITIKCSNLFGLKQNKEAHSLALKSIKEFTDPLFKCQLEILILENSDPKGNLESKLCEFYELSKNSRNSDNTELAIDKLIEHYNQHFKYKQSTVYYEEKLKLQDRKYCL